MSRGFYALCGLFRMAISGTSGVRIIGLGHRENTGSNQAAEFVSLRIGPDSP